MKITDLNCCGIKEFSGLSEGRDPKQMLNEFFRIRLQAAIKAYKAWKDPLGFALQCLMKHSMGTAYVLFTSISSDTKLFKEMYQKEYQASADLLVEFIKANGLGDVVLVPSMRNPNSGNTLHPHLWMLNGPKLVEYYNNLGMFNVDLYRDNPDYQVVKEKVDG